MTLCPFIAAGAVIGGITAIIWSGAAVGRLVQRNRRLESQRDDLIESWQLILNARREEDR